MNEQQPENESQHPLENETLSEDAPLEAPTTVLILATAKEQELEALFAPMTPQPDVTFIVTFALDGESALKLPALAESYAGMPVTIAQQGTPLQPGTVLVIPPETPLLARDGVLQTVSSERGEHRRAGTLLESTVVNRGHRGIVVLLTWNGAGASALREVKVTGGIVLAETHLQHESIAAESMAPHVFDRFLPKPELGKSLLKLLEQARRFRTASAAQELARDAAAHLERILMIVRARTGHDFRQYKRNTIIRRIQRRMHVTEVDSVDGYIEHLRSDGQEAELLFQDMLIGVTHFFRDPEAFELLRTRVIPDILTRKAPGSVVRIWVPGCATGEEAYSIAFLFLDFIDHHGLDLKLQLFATDIDERALATARRGTYPLHVEADVPPDLLRPFMYKADGVLRVNKRVCDCVLFSVHNLVKHPPFSKLDFIACRNLFIYFAPELQARLIPLFHYALLPRGYLFLGPAEGLGSVTNLFSVFDKRFRIFKRSELKPVTSPGLFNFAVPARGEEEEPRFPRRHEKQAAQPGLATLVERTLLEAYSPACVVVNDRFESLYFFGQTGRFLQPAPGAPTLNLLDLARPGLRTQLRACIREAVTRREQAVSEPIEAQLETGPQRVRLLVKPMTDAPEAGLYLVIFQDEDGERHAWPPASAERDGPQEAVIDQLELELKRAQEQLQGSIEEFESSNEELKSSNEELLSMNEELQSSNEELETTKEELQSLNEELETVNSELKLKVEELAHANSDIRNLFENTRIATLFLDNDLRIRNFTPETLQLFSLIDSDRGRPIHHIAQHFRCEDLQATLLEVSRTLVPFEAHVESREGNWFIMRILPYRSIENVIEGVVLTFTDVSQLKLAELEVQRLNRAAESQLRWMKTVMDVIPVGIAYHDSAVVGVHLNRAAVEILGLPPESSVRADVDGLAQVVWRDVEVPEGSRELYELLVSGQAKRDRRVNWLSPAGPRQLVVHTATLDGSSGGSSAQVGAFLDITDIQLAREEAVVREQQHAVVAELGLRALEARDLDEFLDGGLAVLPQLSLVDAAEVLKIDGDSLVTVRRIGFEAEQGSAVTISPADAIPDDGRVLLLDDVTDEGPWSEVLRQEGFTSGARLPISSPEGRPYGVLAVYTRQRRLLSRHDLTFLRSLANVFASAVQRQVIEEARLRERELETLQRSEALLRRAERLASLGTFATGIAHELNNPLNNISLAAESMETEADTTRRAKMIQNIRSNAERCGRIIESVLRFARDESSRKWPIDLNALVQHVTNVVRADFPPERLQFKLELDRSLSTVQCNPTEMEQVFTNLIRNAVQAQTGRCTVTVATERVADCARITVADDGSGIPEDDLAFIFDPFFSTRRRSGGTGLGLSITHRIIIAHAGTIRVSNGEGGGAKFVIELPFNLGEDVQGEGHGDSASD